MNYPIKIKRQENDKIFEVTIPDLPGCQAEGTTIDLAMKYIKSAVKDHLTILAEYGEAIPHATLLETVINNNSDLGITWALIDIDITPYLGKSQKINVTLPELLIKQIDDRVSKSEEHKTRSGFIANACIKSLSS